MLPSSLKNFKELLAGSQWQDSFLHKIYFITQCSTLIFCSQEHEKRCWSVDFNMVDPKLIASGSDDAKGIYISMTDFQENVLSV